MKRSARLFRSWRKVFRFSLVQMLKSKWNTIMLVLFFVAAAAAVPVYCLLGSPAERGGITDEPVLPEEEAFCEAETVYIRNLSDISVTQRQITAYFEDVPYYEKTMFVLTDSVPNEPCPLLLSVETDEASGGYTVRYSGTFADTEGAAAGDLLAELLASILRAEAGIDTAEWERITKSPVWSAKVVSEEPEEPFNDDKFGGTMFFGIAVMYMSVFSVSYVVRGVAEEKSSKLVEYLSVSVGPLAIIIGKILAVLVNCLLMIVTTLTGALLSYVFTARFTDVTVVQKAVLSTIGPLGQIGVAETVVCIITVLLGILVFAAVAGLTGVGCSSVEETGNAIILPMLLILFSYIACMILNMMRIPQWVVVIPFLSAFLLPLMLLGGEIGALWVLASWVIQLALLVGIMVLSGRVYRVLLFYKGSGVGIGRILSIGTKRTDHGERS